MVAAISEKQRDAERKRNKRAAERVVTIPKCVDPILRARLESDDEAWLLWYFGVGCGVTDEFWYEFVPQQKQMIAAITHAIRYGSDQAIAASRGEGKSTIAERLILKNTLAGVVAYSVLFAASGVMADNSLDAIKTAIEENDRLADDYPEVCYPVRALEGAPQRAGSQVCNGERHDNGQPFEMARSKFSWCGQELIFPNIPGSPSAGAIIATRGLDAAVRGLKKRGKRPQLAVIDDPDTEDTARSEEQAKKLETRIDRAIGGLGGQQRGIGRVMLTTLQSRVAVSYRFTDPAQKQLWKGRRFRFLVKPPDRLDLWDEYVQITKADLEEFARRQAEGLDGGDPFSRRAHQLYVDNFEVMNAGAEVSNPNRFDSQILPDGSQTELTALQRYYNEVARIGPEAVATELDNDPPEEAGPVESSITAHRVQHQRSGYPRRVIPPGCTVLTQGIDVGKTALHWVVRAWRPDCIGYVIDHGVTDVHNTVVGSDEGLDVQIRNAIKTRWEEVLEAPYHTVDGAPMQVGLTLIDASYRTTAIYHVCREIGLGIRPAMGMGKSSGCTQANFTDVRYRTRDRKPGDGWFEARSDKRIWYIAMDTDRWKAWEHDRWMTTPGMPGSLLLFGDPSPPGGRLTTTDKEHHSYAHHVVNEKEVEEIVKGQLRRYWKRLGANHWLDASYMSNVAANMLGIKLLNSDGRIWASSPNKPLPSPGQEQAQSTRPRLSLAEMAAKAGR